MSRHTHVREEDGLPPPMTRADLAKIPPCPCGAAHGMDMVSRCHPDDGLEVNYQVATGVLTVSCFTCDAVVAMLQIAAQPAVLA